MFNDCVVENFPPHEKGKKHISLGGKFSTMSVFNYMKNATLFVNILY